ncbi:MAG: TetR family transcriptional regulator C-terminal domain-containing protein [Pseudomonadota bacterium]
MSAKAAKKRTRIQIANENKILEAARDVIAEFGFHGATIDRVAEAAGMSKPNLHYYFRTKEDLYRAVLRSTLEDWIAPLSNLDPDGDPSAELGAYIDEKLELSRRHPNASRVFANEVLRGAPILKPYLQGELRATVARKIAVIKGWIDKGALAPMDPVHLIFLIWAATQHYADFLPQVHAVMNKDALDDADYAQVSASLKHIILKGVLP